MGLFEKLKSLLGLEEDGESTADDRDVGITVERERGEGTASTRRQDGDAADTGGNGDGSASASPGGGVSASDATATTGSESDTATASGAAPTPDAAESTDEDDRRVPSEAVDVIKGIGPTYAGRLSDAGIETVADLAAADAADVAERADVPEGRLDDWIERARNRSR